MTTDKFTNAPPVIWVLADGRAGNRSQAIEHYRVAAQAQTPVGQQARERLQSMGVAPSG